VGVLLGTAVNFTFMCHKFLVLIVKMVKIGVGQIIREECTLDWSQSKVLLFVFSFRKSTGATLLQTVL